MGNREKDELLSVHHFIKKFKDENNGNLDKYKRFEECASKSLSDGTSGNVIPPSESPIQKFIHGDIFEYSVQKASGNQTEKDDPWGKFKDLYPNIKAKDKKIYCNFMDEAGKIAWDILNKNVRKIYGRKSKSICYSFGHHIQNYGTFPFLTKKLEADVFVSSIPYVVCDIKYSSMDKEQYEKEYLVHAIIQVLIYSMAMDLDMGTLHLRVLVFYSKTCEAVLYQSDLHNHVVVVNRLFRTLKGKKKSSEANRNDHTVVAEKAKKIATQPTRKDIREDTNGVDSPGFEEFSDNENSVTEGERQPASLINTLLTRKGLFTVRKRKPLHQRNHVDLKQKSNMFDWNRTDIRYKMEMVLVAIPFVLIIVMVFTWI